jgi:LmbE family N-acetylglucosaminyl deacetylase
MALLPMERVLVVAAHPDDDILGCGATLARLSAGGAAVRVLFLADGVGSREDQPQRDSERREDARRALAHVGVHDGAFANLPDNALDTVPLLELCRLVTEEVERFAPDTVLTHSLADLNIDHRLCADAATVASRPQPSSPVRRLLHFEVPSATGWRPAAQQFDPRYHVEVTDHVDAKMAALREYDVEMRPWPHARSYDAVQALLRWRGSLVGVAAAESFEVSLWLETA